MSIKYTIIGDPHCTPKNLDKIAQLLDQAEDLGNTVIILGDLLDTKSVVRSECLNLYFEKLSKSKLSFYILVGNHDYHNLQCEDHSLKTLKALSNVIIIDQVFQTEWATFLPFIQDKSKLKEILESTPEDHVVFGHFEVTQFDFGNGHICEDGLTLEDFSRFKRVISGHFHKHQVTDNFTYLGTPFSHSFGEANQVKYIAEYEIIQDTLNLIQTTFPQHVSLKLDISTKTADTKLKKFLKDNVNNIVRVQLAGTSEQISQFKKPEGLIKWEEKPISTFDNSISLDETLDNKSQFATWATQIKKLDLETIKLGLSILENLKGGI
jgi:DNA repair exonuclease SbcCD nuclease subunit